ncbi:MAG: VWA domain-containing protein [Bacteroidia bacterium]|nr:VWA domain-containing protein [Bacteroidia bacterium]
MKNKLSVIVFSILIALPVLIMAQPKQPWWKAIRFTRIPMEDTLTTRVPCIAVSQDNVIWTGREGFLCGWDDTKKQWDYHKIGDSIQAIDIEETKGTFWIATAKRKVIEYDKATKAKKVHTLTSLKRPYVHINTLFVENSNNIWIGTDEGLVLLKQTYGEWKNTAIPDLVNMEVYDIVRHNGVIKVATDMGLYQYLGTSWSPVPKYDRKKIWSADVNPAEELFLAYNVGKKDYVFSENTQIGVDSSRRYRFNDILADDYGRFWGATLGGVYAWADVFGYWHYFNDLNSDLNVSEAYVSAQDVKSGIWVGAKEGLYKIIDITKKEEEVATPVTPPVVVPKPGNTEEISDTIAYLQRTSDVHLVLVLDISGSMQTSITRMGLAFKNILKYLPPKDHISIITYANKAEVIAENWSADKTTKKRIAELFDGFTYKGGTNIKAALNKALSVSQDNKIPGGNNRIVLVSDANFDVPGRYPTASQIASYGIKFSVFCSQKKTKAQEKELMELTKRGKGNYFNFAVGNTRTIEQAFWSELMGE